MPSYALVKFSSSLFAKAKIKPRLPAYAQARCHPDSNAVQALSKLLARARRFVSSAYPIAMMLAFSSGFLKRGW
ncbi:hypothetical protein IMZ48_42705 [Candidatus Bathyarchaeota archaeon]|nr:hypothetical protein [Candidatus Bathyarchaeota archaeon]